MSQITGTKSFLFHTDLGAVILKVDTVAEYDVEDIIRRRAIAQARVIQMYNQAKQSNPNDLSAPRTMESVYTRSGEELPE